MPELWLRKTFPKVMFLNSNLPECRYRIFCKKGELDDSADIFQKNMLDGYTDRPDQSLSKWKVYCFRKSLFFRISLLLLCRIKD